MRVLLVTSCLWPGLPRLWLRGEWSALAAAIAFGAALNLVLVSSFVWPELLPSSLVVVGWLLVSGACCLSAIRSYRVLPVLLHTTRVDDRGLFLRAQGEYLQGHWFEAETTLQQLLRHAPRDAEAQLLLATLYRHTGRAADAQERLRRLELLDGAQRWEWEIARERQLIATASARDDGGNSQTERTGTNEATN